LRFFVLVLEQETQKVNGILTGQMMFVGQVLWTSVLPGLGQQIITRAKHGAVLQWKRRGCFLSGPLQEQEDEVQVEMEMGSGWKLHLVRHLSRASGIVLNGEDYKRLAIAT
jgi:hypothetical protein